MDEFKTQLAKYGKTLARGVVALVFSGALLLFAQFAGTLKSFQFIGQDVEFRNTITVSGEGKVMVVPDVAEFSFAVVENAKQVKDAQTAVTNVMNGIIKYLKDFGLEEKDIKTTNYSITPKYEYRADVPKGGVVTYPYPQPGNQVLVGYEVSHWISVKIHKTEDVGTLLAKVGSMGATDVSGIQFTVDDEEKSLREARQIAIDNAKDKAHILAGDLGVRLVKIVTFSESGSPMYYREMKLGAMSADGGLPAPEIPVGENTVTSNISITYAIE